MQLSSSEGHDGCQYSIVSFKMVSISTIIQVGYNIIISREMAMASDPLESGFVCLVCIFLLRNDAPLCSFFVLPFSPYWCVLVGVLVEQCLFVPMNTLKF